MPSLRIVKRQEPWKWGSCFIFPSALAISLALSALILTAMGKPGLGGLTVLFEGAFGASWALVDTLIKAGPIFLCSLGVAVTFRMQVWNIGAEGQYALGCIGAGGAALAFPEAPGVVLLPLMLACAAVAGGLWALVPALLKTRLRVNEIISTLMLNYIGILFLEYLVYGPWKDKRSHGFPMTTEFGENAILPGLFGSRIHAGFIFCVVVAVLIHIMLRYTRTGYELRAAGSEPKASYYARMNFSFLVVFVMVVCGALAGTGGFLETSAVVGRLQPGVIAGYGYTAIVVAWLARLNPLAIAVVSFLLAALRVGVENMQLELQMSSSFGGILEGLILLSVLAGQFFHHYRLVLESRRTG